MVTSPLYQPHRPDCVMIDAYGDGGFRFDEMSHKGHLFISPEGMFPWTVSAPQSLIADDFTPFLDMIKTSDVLLIGLGRDISSLPSGLRSWFNELDIHPDFMDTGAAARTYNVLLAEQRLVCVALIAVE